MSSFTQGFVRPHKDIKNVVKTFQGTYTGQDVVLLQKVKPGQYVYANHTVFVDDGGTGQLIYPNDLDEDQYRVVNGGILKSYGTEYVRYIGHVAQHSIDWEALLVPFFNNGIENVSWVAGAYDGTGVHSSTHIENTGSALYVWVGGTSVCSVAVVRTYVTDIPVDLTNLNTLRIPCTIGHPAGDHARNVKILVLTNKMTNSSAIASLVVTDNSFEGELSLDVSQISGSYYIAIAAMVGQSTQHYIKAYSVFGTE